MHHVRHQDDRDCQVCQDAVRLLDQRQQTKLCDEEVCDAASEGGVDSFDHGGNHVDGCGYGTEDDQYGNQRCHEFTADALLNHK